MQSSISTSLSDGLIGSCMNLNVAFFCHRANSSNVSSGCLCQPMLPNKSLLFCLGLGFSAPLAPLALLALRLHSCVDFPAKISQFPPASRPLRV